MAKKKYDEANIQAIAEAIRDKTGSEETYKASEMASGVNEVYEAGKKAESDAFWDSIDFNAQYAFMGTAWNEHNFKPNKDIPVTVGTFERHAWDGKKPYDLKNQLEKLGVKLIFIAGSDNFPFRYANFYRLPKCDFSMCSGVFDRVFYGMGSLETIVGIVFPAEGAVTSYNQPFYGCKLLKFIHEASGVIDQSIDFSPAPLNVESMKRIILLLKNFSGTDREYTCTFSLSSKCKTILEEEGATAEYTDEEGNTIFVKWTEYISLIGWTLK